MKSRKGIWILWIVVCVLAGCMCLNQDHSDAASATGVVTAASLNVRSGAGTNYNVVNTLAKGTKVTVLNTADGWYEIEATVNNEKITGYVSATYVAMDSAATPTPTAVPTEAPTPAPTVYYRLETTTNPISVAARIRVKTKVYKNKKYSYYKVSKRKVTLNKNKKVTILGESRVKGVKWLKIRFTYKKKKRTAYIPEYYVTMTLKTKPTAKVNSLKKSIKLYKKAKSGSTVVKSRKKKVTLKKNTAVTILSNKVVKKKKWYRISAKYKNKTVKGWTLSKYITLTKPVVQKKVKVVALSEADFEKSMTAQGFPESYKPYLRALHQKYPYWQFKAFKTGVKFQDALTAESKLGENLISNSKSEAWKSKEAGAYDSATGTWKVFDGSTWVAASKEAIAYYMDPRNFLNDRTVFMFESLEYQPEYQTAAGVNKILSNTPFYGKSFSYVDTTDNKTNRSITYTNAFLAAAKINGVSPYHLASRVKQEVVTSATTTSIAVTGTNSSYPGIFNFYNIGATSGSNPAVNGLKWASSGTTYLRPWTDRYRSIVGGAQYIGQSYIQKGQNTGYLEKFNLTANSRYSHQYMTNVEAAYSEAIKTKNAYAGLMDASSIVFSIPVFTEMPSSPCAAPQ